MEKMIWKSKKGNMGAMSGVVGLVIGLGLSILTLIFMATLGGATYGAAETQINAISNATVKDAVKAASVAGFGGYTTLGNFLPIVVLAGLVGVVLVLILGSFNFAGGGGGYL